jgi:hypothetical protein
MKKETLLKLPFLWKTAFIVAMLLFSTTFSSAQATACTAGNTTTFAQFNQTFGGQDFRFTNSNPISSFETIQGGTPVEFTYLNIVNLPPALQGTQSARVFVSATTSQQGFVNVGRSVQPFNNTFTISVIRDFPAPGGGTNLLTATVTNTPTLSTLSGDSGGNSAGYTASTPNQVVTFTSDFLSFGGTQARNLALSFSSIQPNFTINNINGFLNSFTAAGTGTFASCPAPTTITAAGAQIQGRVMTPAGKGLAKARVALTYSTGETLTTTTNSFGYYRFTDVEVGQSVILNVHSKRYVYAAKVLNVGEDLYESDFFPE